MNKLYFLKIFLIFFIPLELITLYLIHSEKERNVKDVYQSMESHFMEKLRLKKEYVKETFIPLINDARYLSSKPSIHNFLDTTYKSELEADIRVYALSSPHYHQIRILDMTGKEAIRINNNGKEVHIVPKASLQNKGHRPYFLKSKALDKDEIYLSSIDLNIEKGKIELPLQPTIRVVIPIFKEQERQGLLVINYNAKRFLQKINEIDHQEGISFFLLNEKGYFLSAEKGYEKFGFMFNESKEKFDSYFPRASKSIFQKARGAIKTNKGLFYSLPVHITKEIAMNNKYASKLTGESNKWQMIYFIHKSHLDKILKKHEDSFFIYAMIATGVSLFVAIVFALMRKKEKVFIHDLLELNASLDEKVNHRTEQLSNTKIELEDKVQDLLSSIRYAKKVQETILPQTRIIKSYFPKSFILFLPKDIVAGDFYWMESLDNTHEVLFAVADCTGHGVPGAMVSIVCYNALNKAVKNEKLTNPSLILNRVAELVEQSFCKGNEDDLNDGMDVSLCKINFETHTLEWAGANNPLWIVRRELGTIESEVLEIKPDRQPIGKFPGKRKPFRNHEMTLKKNDTIYMMSDGFQDQFNSTGTEKLKRARMKQLIQKVNELDDLTTQRDYLLSFLKEWKGETPQIDDICVVGLKL